MHKSPFGGMIIHWKAEDLDREANFRSAASGLQFVAYPFEPVTGWAVAGK